MKPPLISGVYRHLSSALCGYWEWIRNIGAVAWVDTRFACLWWGFVVGFVWFSFFSFLWKKWVMCFGAGASLALTSEIPDVLSVTLAKWLGEKGDACVPSLPPRGSDGFSRGGWAEVTSHFVLRQSRGQPSRLHFP